MAERKIAQNAVSRGKRRDNNILKVQILLSRILLSLRRLLMLKGGKTPHPKTLVASLRKQLVVFTAKIVFFKDPDQLTKDMFVVKFTKKSLAVKPQGSFVKSFCWTLSWGCVAQVVVGVLGWECGTSAPGINKKRPPPPAPILARWHFQKRGSGILLDPPSAREFLLKIDTSLAIATSGLRTNLLFEPPPLPKTPHSIFPTNVFFLSATQIWPEMTTSRDAKSTCFQGSRTSCDVMILALASKDHIMRWIFPAKAPLSDIQQCAY